ncbi:MAG: hypothetical protein H0T42_24830 [Deltaproteobacteria bacterium]|nr:hypothetical protein [Deltaproteobacteria bacterium]
MLREAAAVCGGQIDKRGRLTLDTHGTHIEVTVPEDTRSQEAFKSRWHASLTAPGTTHFEIYPHGIRDALLGIDELVLDLVPRFDLEFAVTASSPDVFRRLWTVDLCGKTLESFGQTKLTSTGAHLELVRTGRVDAALIVRGIDLLLAIARTDLFGVAVLHALPDAVPQLDNPAAVQIKGPGTICVGLHPITPQEHVTRATAHIAGLEPFPRIEVVAGDIATDALATLPPRIHGHARLLGSARIAADGPDVIDHMGWHRAGPRTAGGRDRVAACAR